MVSVDKSLQGLERMLAQRFATCVAAGAFAWWGHQQWPDITVALLAAYAVFNSDRFEAYTISDNILRNDLDELRASINSSNQLRFEMDQAARRIADLESQLSKLRRGNYSGE